MTGWIGPVKTTPTVLTWTNWRACSDWKMINQRQHLVRHMQTSATSIYTHCMYVYVSHSIVHCNMCHSVHSMYHLYVIVCVFQLCVIKHAYMYSGD